MQQAFQEYLKRVKTIFPTFERFDKGDEDFTKSERNYKLEIIELFNQEIQIGLSSLPVDEAGQAELGRKIISLFTRKLSDGKPQNLVGWRYFEFIHNLDIAKQAQFARLTASLLYGSEELSSRVDQFVSGLGSLSGKDQTNWAAMSRSVTSFLLMLSNPQDHVIIKTNEFRHAFQAFLNQKIPNRNLTGEDYLEIQKFLYALRKEMIESGLAPRDLIDVQSFIWVGDQDYNKENQMSDEMDTSEKAIEIPSQQPKNQIIYGAAGTGKTYHTINKALEIIAPQFLADNLNDRKALKARFDQLINDEKEKRIRFVTFHQSFSYEDFVEGIRAVTNEETKQIHYKVESGVFKLICEEAVRHHKTEASLGISKSPRIWKISIADAGSRAYCLEHGEARIGWSHAGDLSNQESYQSEYFKNLGSNDRNTLNAFYSEMQLGDIVVCLKTSSEISSVGVVGEYFFDKNPPQGVSKDDCNTRKVNWILKNIAFDIRSLNGNKFLTLKTVYELYRFTWSELQVALEEAGHVLVGKSQSIEKREPYVLIIDEINRGNISRIFGELITLIEDSKRQGADEALSVILPYSQKPFRVPDNVYIIGTMNSSDRSLTGLDIALRRRFTFIEMQPKPETLNHININGLNIGQLLTVINQRIEILLDRDHCIGHAYFMPLEADPTTNKLSHIFQQKIMPLFQEYFYDDWERINWVLNDNGMLIQKYQDVDKLFPKSAHGKLQNQCWKVNSDAFNDILNYQNIIGVAQ